MQHDEVIWQVIRHNHCSYMTKISTGNFCRNPYNVTGACNRSSCPLANSRYATIRDDNGVFYLYMKTIERAHMPKDLWERVKLPRNYEKALEIIDKHLMYWPKLLIHKIKQRLTKMTQMRIRMRKLALKTREKIMTTPRKEKKREARREEKAEKAALLEKSIEKELLERLQKGVYQQSDIYNYPLKEYNKVLDMENLQAADEEDEEDEEEPEVEYVEGYDELEEEEDIEDFGGFATHKSQGDYDDDENAGSTDDEEAEAFDQSRGKRKMPLASKRLEKNALDSKSKKTRVIVEVEREGADERQRVVHRDWQIEEEVDNGKLSTVFQKI
ncbi:mak16 [Mucuna pruriens]|uniref:Protein MAK16 homolog n=1 Tax=Mucuna pruriens TaxID=157652 RepID=A0A371FEV3_MUCPR|nr:mak16 [Mucuna pruriens]